MIGRLGYSAAAADTGAATAGKQATSVRAFPLHSAFAPDFFTTADHLVSSRSMSAAYSSGRGWQWLGAFGRDVPVDFRIAAPGAMRR